MPSGNDDVSCQYL